MFFRKKKTPFYQDAIIYSVSNIINRIAPFLLLPILTTYLSTEDYGIISIFTILVSILGALVGINTHGAITKNFFDRTKTELKVYISSIFYILIFSVISISLIILIINQFFSKIFSLPNFLIWIALIIATSQFISSIILNLWQVQKKAFFFAIYSFIKTTINILLSIFFIIFLNLNWQGNVYAQLITALLFFFLSVFILLKNNSIGIVINKNYILDALKFGGPLIPHMIGAIFMTMIDRFFITLYSGINETGIYSVGYQIGSIINILAISFNQAYIPWLYEKLNLKSLKTNIKIVKITYIYFIIILVITFLLIIVMYNILLYFIGKEFFESVKYIPWIALGYAFHGMYYMVSAYIFYSNKTKYLGITMALLALINVVLNTLLIPLLGPIGAAYATTIIYFLEFIVIWILASHIYPMPWNLLAVKKES
jgi:O-antigen/teichoic acid export membrane protein